MDTTRDEFTKALEGAKAGDTVAVDQLPDAAAAYLESAKGEPAWLAGADSEELAELSALGLTAPPPSVDADRDALISSLLRAHHEHEQDAERYDEAEKREHDAIKRRYDLLRAPARRQMERLGAFLIHVVGSVVFTGRTKSRKVGWGSYGKRKVADSALITDEHALIKAAMDLDAGSVKATIVTNGATLRTLQQWIAFAVTQPGTGTALTGTDIFHMTELRADLEKAQLSVSKTAAKALIPAKQERAVTDALVANPNLTPAEALAQATKDGSAVLPGVTLQEGGDKPWFEVEAPVAIGHGG